MTVRVHDMTFWLCHVSVWISLSCRPLKNSKYKESFSLNFLYLPNDRASKRTSVVVDPVPGSFINQGRWTLTTGEETRKTLSQTIIPPVYSAKGPFVFPENHLLSPKRPVPFLPFFVKIVFNLNSRLPLGVTHFYLGISHAYMRYTCQ